MSFRARVYFLAIGGCLAFWVVVTMLIVTHTRTTPPVSDEWRICNYLADHSLGATWRYTVDELGMSSDAGVTAIEDARRNVCPSLLRKG